MMFILAFRMLQNTFIFLLILNAKRKIRCNRIICVFIFEFIFL